MKDCGSAAKCLPRLICKLPLVSTLRVIEMKVNPGGHHYIYQNTFKQSSLYGKQHKCCLLEAKIRSLNFDQSLCCFLIFLENSQVCIVL